MARTKVEEIHAGKSPLATIVGETFAWTFVSASISPHQPISSDKSDARSQSNIASLLGLARD